MSTTKTVYILCKNDFPFIVFESEHDAKVEKERAEAQGFHGLHYIIKPTVFKGSK